MVWRLTGSLFLRPCGRRDNLSWIMETRETLWNIHLQATRNCSHLSFLHRWLHSYSCVCVHYSCLYRWTEETAKLSSNDKVCIIQESTKVGVLAQWQYTRLSGSLKLLVSCIQCRVSCPQCRVSCKCCWVVACFTQYWIHSLPGT